MHPLDPLSADEFRHAAAVLRREQGVDERWRFASIELREPDMTAWDLLGEAVRLRKLALGGVPLFVYDRVDVAVAARA